MMFALRQMMSLSLMMTASPNDVASLMFLANIASLRPTEQHHICEANASHRVAIHHFILLRIDLFPLLCYTIRVQSKHNS